MIFTIKLKLLLILIVYTNARKNECFANTKNGPIRGVLEDTRNPSKKSCAFTGIPYAAPPVGNLRFKSPQPAAPWNETLNATVIPNWCPQAGNAPPGVDISEDCLYLNVYRPLENLIIPTDNLPVMIWIHGGAFIGGNAQIHSNSKLLGREQDVILVVVQYRLGFLGFLSSGDLISPGNYGLKDQSFAIKWVFENIADFGGNPRKITIFGQSAGGASVMYQLISPLNKGLLNGAIAQSGTTLAMWALDRTPEASGKLIANLLGCPTSSTILMVACLRLLNWQKIVEVQQNYVNTMFQNMIYGTAGISPVVEPWHPEAFISSEPLEIMEMGNIPNIPVIIGANKHDGSFILAMLYAFKYGPEHLDKNPDYLRREMIPGLIQFIKARENIGNRALSSAVEITYLPKVNRSSWDEIMPGLVDFLTVSAFKSSIENTAAILNRRGLPVYLYSFEHHSNNTLQSFPKNGIPVEGGIGHSDDLIYLFDFIPQELFSEEDKAFENLFCDLWLNFAVLGNPTPPTSTVAKWSSYNEEGEFYMKLNVTPTLLENYRNSWTPRGFQWN